MTRDEFVARMKELKTDDEWLAFEEECYNTWTEEDKEEIGAAAMPLTEKCSCIRYLREKHG